MRCETSRAQSDLDLVDSSRCSSDRVRSEHGSRKCKSSVADDQERKIERGKSCDDLTLPQLDLVHRCWLYIGDQSDE